MVPRKATAIVFLCLSIVVAFANILVNRYYYLIFIVPFILACALHDRPGQIAEAVGLYLGALYFVWFEDVLQGILAFILVHVFFFALSPRRIISRIYIIANSVAIFAASYIKFADGADRITHALLDALFFAVLSFSVYGAFYRALIDARTRDKPLDQKCIDTLEALRRVARETLDILKQMQGGPHD